VDDGVSTWTGVASHLFDSWEYGWITVSGIDFDILSLAAEKGE
jgi:hypothetical protein